MALAPIAQTDPALGATTNTAAAVYQPPASAATPAGGSGVYWVGQDGNVYLKGPGGNSASVTNLGSANNLGSTQDTSAIGNAAKINDPMAGVNTNTGSSTSSTTGSGAGGLYPNINVPAYNQAVIDKLNATLSGANTTYQQAQNYLPTQLKDAQYEAGGAINNAQVTATGRVSGDETNIANTNSERQLALSQLADQIHGQYQGLLSQLGAVGAGNSSAAEMGTQALGHEQAINSASTNMNADTQNASANTDIATTNKSLASYIAQQQDALKTTIDNINSQFGTLLNNLKTQIGEATPEAQQQLAYFGSVLSGAAQQAAGQAVAQYTASLAPVEANMASQGQASATDLANAQGNVAQYMQTNPANGVNIGAYTLGSAVTPTPIITSNISPFQPASTGNTAATPSGNGFAPQNSQTSGPGNDAISYLNSLLSSAPATSGG